MHTFPEIKKKIVFQSQSRKPLYRHVVNSGAKQSKESALSDLANARGPPGNTGNPLCPGYDTQTSITWENACRQHAFHSTSQPEICCSVKFYSTWAWDHDSLCPLKCTHCCFSCPFFPALSMVWHTFQRALMIFFPEPLDPIAMPGIPHSQSYLSTSIPSAPTHNLAAVLGEQTLSIYLLVPLFLRSAAAQSNETSFCLKKKKVLCHTKTARKNCSQCRGCAVQHSRSNNADAAFPLRISQTLHSPSSLVERGQAGTEVGRITTVCKHQHTGVQAKAQF